MIKYILDKKIYYYKETDKKKYENKYFLGEEDATIKAIDKQLCRNVLKNEVNE